GMEIPNRFSRGPAISRSKELSVTRFCARSLRPCSTRSPPGRSCSVLFLIVPVVTAQKIFEFFLKLLRINGGIAHQLRFDLGEPGFQLRTRDVSTPNQASDVL